MSAPLEHERQPESLGGRRQDSCSVDHAVRFFEPSAETALVAGDALAALVDLYIETALQRKFSFALIWPGSLDSLPLVHSLACFKLWAGGENCSLRGAYYPAKRNTFYPLNRLFVSKSSLTDMGSRMLFPQGPRSQVPAPDLPLLRSKAVILLAVNSMRTELQEADIRPCINELMPHFFLECDGEKFKDYTEHFYFRVRSKLADAAHKKALKSCTFPDVSGPGNAPDALFALGHGLTIESLDKALKDIKKFGAPQVIVLDATWKAVRAIHDWRQRFFNFIVSVRRIFPEQSPGFLFVTDEPRQMALFRAMLTDEEKGVVKREILDVRGFLETEQGLGLQKIDERPAGGAAQGALKVVVTDHEVGALLDSLYKVYAELAPDTTEASVITDVITFLTRLSQLPGSTRAMWQYFGQREIDAQTRDSFDWKCRRVNVWRFLESGKAKEARARLEALLFQCDKVVEAYDEQTPLGAALLIEIAASDAAGERLAVVVRRNFHKEVVSRFLPAENAEGWNGRVVLAEELEQSILGSSFDRLLFADMSSLILRTIVTNQNLPQQVTLVLAAPAAKQLYYTLGPLFELSAFGPLWPRLNQIYAPLSERVDSKVETLWSQDRTWNSTFKLTFLDRTDDEPGVEDREAVLIETTGPLIRRGFHSTVYVYNALEAADGHSGFRAKEAGKIKKGDEIVVISADLREAVQQTLSAAGAKSNFASTFEEGLRSYHARISSQLDICFKGHKGHRTGQLRMLHDKIVDASPELESEVSNLSYWVNLEGLIGKSFDEITTRAPRTFKAFKVFCHALRIDDFETIMYWNLILDMRKARRADGRWVSDVYTRLLFDEAEVIAYNKVPTEAIRALRHKVFDDVFTVIDVLLPN